MLFYNCYGIANFTPTKALIESLVSWQSFVFMTLSELQVNLDMTDSMGPGKLVRHMQNPSYTYDEYLICIGLGPSMSSVICKTMSYSGPSYPSSPVLVFRGNEKNVSLLLCNHMSRKNGSPAFKIH